jgi:hypothetical protein
MRRQFRETVLPSPRTKEDVMKTREHRENNRRRGDPTEEIRHEAYLLWQQEGCPQGREIDHWLAAQELVRHRQHQAKRPDAPDEDPREPDLQPTERLVTPT